MVGLPRLRARGSEKFWLRNFECGVAVDKFFLTSLQVLSFLTCKMGVVICLFSLWWKFSEFMTVKLSTNEIYYYLGPSRGKSERAAAG